jgi:hypothetical protein
MAAASVGSPVEVFYFTHPLANAPETRLAAAVAWRLAPGVGGGSASARPAEPPWGRGPAAWLRRLRHRLWLRFGPLGLDVGSLGKPYGPSDGGVRSSGFVWDAEPRIYFDGRVVRLLGRVYKMPPESRTLVLLVDEGPAAGAAPRVTARTVPAPVNPVLPAAPPPPGWESGTVAPGSGWAPFAPFREDVLVGGQHPAWEAALRADPDVRAFLDGS